jgi:spermidine synthase
MWRDVATGATVQTVISVWNLNLKGLPLARRVLDRVRPGVSATLAAVLLGMAPTADAARLLESHESLYNNIYIYDRGGYISMIFGHNRKLFTETVYNPRDETELPVAYTRYMTASLSYPQRLETILEIGCGGGRTAWYLHRFLPNTRITSVELDPAVVELSRKHFGIRNERNFDVVSRDGRLYLSRAKERYDVILIDAYRGPFVPFHLLTREFYEIVRDRLADGGVLAQNVEPSTMLFDSAVNTIHSVFPHVEFYQAGGNVVTVAYAGKARSNADMLAAAQARQESHRFRYNLVAMLAERRRFVSGDGTVDLRARVLTDDFAPVDSLKAIEKHNRKWPIR